MEREEFLRIVPAPGMMMVEPENDDRPCESIYEQPCRIVRHDPGYDGIFGVGTIVLLSQMQLGPVHFFMADRGGRPLLMISVDMIVGRVPR